MRHGSRWTLLGLPLLFLLPALAADKKDEKPVPASQQDYNQLIQQGHIAGKLVKVDPKRKTLTVEVEYEHLQANNNKGGNNAQLQQQVQQQQQILREQAQIMQVRDPVQRMRRLQQLVARIQRQQIQAANNQNNQQNAFKVVTSKKDFELEANEDVKVRILTLPEVFDDKGNVKKYKPEELKELKGPNASLPGYISDFDKLEVGQIVKVHLDKSKSAPKGAKAKDAEEDPPNVSLIVVEKPAEPPAGKDKKKK